MPTPIVVAIELDDEHALGRADMEHDAPARPARRDLEVALVDAGRVALRDRRRQTRERHLDVGVVGQVPGVRPSSTGSGRRASRHSGPGLVVGSGGAAGTATGRRARAGPRCGDAVHRQPAEPGQLGVVQRVMRHCRSTHRPLARSDCGRWPTPDPVTIRATGLGRRFGATWAVRGHGSRGPPRRGPRPARAERRGQDDDGPDADRADRAERGPRNGRRASTSSTQPEGVRARVGILTETPGLYDKLSATANLDFFGRLYGLDAATRAERIERYLRLFSLWDRRDDAAGTFSKGMKQKLAIARALLHEPAVVFLDEPTAALDPEAAYIVREAIEALRRSGRTIVLATHNLDEANRLCDRVAFVRGGLLRIDSPAELRGSLGGRGVEIGLARRPGAALVAAARSVPGVTGSRLSTVGWSSPPRTRPR